ncbi:zinc/manganese transport system permease protein [Gammaproteobacteria bacterium]
MTIWEWGISPFVEFSFMRRALLGSLAVALGCAPIGVFLLLRRMSLMGDAMSHAILPGAAVGFLLAGMSVPALSLGGLVAGLTVALASGALSRTTDLREDASLAVFYLLSLALGVLLVSLKGSSVDLLHVLFGSVLALDDDALWLLGGITGFTLPVLTIIFRPLVIESFDPGFLRVVSRCGPWVHMTFLVLVVLNLVGGFQALGTLMAVGMMMLPAAIAQFWARSLPGMMVAAVLSAFLSDYFGLLFSYHLALPSGPAIVLTAGGLLGLSLVFSPRRGLIARFWPRSHLEG